MHTTNYLLVEAMLDFASILVRAICSSASVAGKRSGSYLYVFLTEETSYGRTKLEIETGEERLKLLLQLVAPRTQRRRA